MSLPDIISNIMPSSTGDETPIAMDNVHADDLLPHFQRGDLKALGCVVHLFQREIHYFATHIVKDRETAEEIVDDCFLKAWNIRTKFSSITDIKGFLFVTARNACLDYIKSPRNRISERIDAGAYPLASNENIEAQLIYTELLSAVYKEVTKLPDKQRQVFQFSYMDGLSTQEIAERMGISHNAVAINKHEATKAIRRLFKGKDILFYLLLLQYLEGVH